MSTVFIGGECMEAYVNNLHLSVTEYVSVCLCVVNTLLVHSLDRKLNPDPGLYTTSSSYLKKKI